MLAEGGMFLLQVAAVPVGDVESLRRGRMRVPGDDLEAGRERRSAASSPSRR